jgi:hypothetical protein
MLKDGILKTLWWRRDDRAVSRKTKAEQCPEWVVAYIFEEKQPTGNLGILLSASSASEKTDEP